MFWKRKRKYKGKNENYSILKKLRKDKKSNEEFEIMLNNLSLEEVIALKLELSTKPVNNRLYGIPLWSTMPTITKDAVFKYAVSATRTQGEAMRFLGLTLKHYRTLKRKFNIDSYFT